MSDLFQLNNLGISYDSGFGIKNISISIQKNTITALVGPNGSGKTSILNILSFLTLPDDGEIKYKDIVVSRDNLPGYRQTVGYIQQSPYLLRGTSYKNIELGLKLRHAEKTQRKYDVDEVMKLMGIENLADRDARTLSGGEAQKVAIAQVLVLKPDVLILDEPFTHLDKKSIHELEQILIKLKQDLDKTVIFTTHDKFQAQWLADKVYNVVNGKVFESQLANLFSGHLLKDQNRFDTGKQRINLPEGITEAEHIGIDPRSIVLSRSQIDSSMQNSYQGKVSKMAEENGQVRVSVEAGEIFEAVISHQTLNDMGLSIGTDIWISFKSSSILVF